MSRPLSASVLLVTLLLLAGPAGASSLLQVIHLEQGQNINAIPEELLAFDEVFDASSNLDALGHASIPTRSSRTAHSAPTLPVG